MTAVNDIVFGDAILPTATATAGTLEDSLLTVSGANVTILKPNLFRSGRMKVQWKVGARPQAQVRRLVDVGTHVVAVHLNQK